MKASPSPKSSLQPQTAADTGLALIAFVLLATGLCVRSLLGEIWGAFLTDLLDISGTKVCGSLMVRYTVYLVTVAGIGAALLYSALRRRRWSSAGLEIPAAILAVAAILSFPVSSDKRVAINSAIDVILPLAAAACLYQLLLHRASWRRALLAILIATAAANVYKATSQKYIEYPQAVQEFRQQRDAPTERFGWNPGTPENALLAAKTRAIQPLGYFQHANVLASYLAMGLAAVAVALIASGWWPKAPHPDNPASPPPPLPLIFAATVLLVWLAVWLLTGMRWVGSAGVFAGLGTLLIGAPIAWLWRSKPKRLAILLIISLGLMQVTLMVLATQAPDLYPTLLSHGGKIKSLAVRLNYWEGAMKLFVAHPFAGVGPGQFSQHYLMIKPVYAAEGVLNPHNWLLWMAAEWGIVGLVGWLLALTCAGWKILRELALPPQAEDSPWHAALLPAGLVLLACWTIAIWDMSPEHRHLSMLLPVGVSLIAGAAGALSRLRGHLGQIILLAGGVMFFVQSMVGTEPSTPGAVWPFWAMVTLTMAWKGPQTLDLSGTPRRRLPAWTHPALCGAIALAVVALTIQPLRAFRLMDAARRQLGTTQKDQAVEILRHAATVDRLDPLPLNIAAYLQRQLIAYNPSREMHYLKAAVELYEATVQRDPISFGRWRNLAISQMYLACAISDPNGVRDAIIAMRQTLTIYPASAQAWVELARMAAVTNESLPDDPAMLRMAIEATDKALAIDQQWDPDDKLNKFTAQQRADLIKSQSLLQQRLQAALARTASTLPAD